MLIFRVFCPFSNFCCFSLKLRLVKVDKGILQDLYVLVFQTKNTHFYTNFHNFFQVFSKFMSILSYLALGVKDPPLGFDNKLLHSL